jgi:hypothetical protein
MSEHVEIPSAAPYRMPRRQRIDPGTKRLALIAAGLAAVLLSGVGFWSRPQHPSSRIPVVEADPRPLRVKPDNPGGLQVAGANDEILSGDSGPQNGRLAPPPETPEPQALRPQPEPQPLSPGKPEPLAAAPVTAAPGASLAPVTAVPAEHKLVPAAERKPAATAEKKQATPQAAATPAHPPEVQIAALGSEEAARAEWDRLVKRMPELLKGRSPSVSKTEHDGHAFWRLRTGGFSDIAQATTFCERMRAKGGGCSIASF